MMKRLLVFMLVFVMLFTMVGCGGKETTGNEGEKVENGVMIETTENVVETNEPQYGGIFVVALDAEPSGLDNMIASSSLTLTVSWNIFETLFTFGSEGEIVPLLAKNAEISEDGLTYMINIREGVKFHDGSLVEMTDVLASFNRWIAFSGEGKNHAENLESAEITGDNQVTFKLVKPNPSFYSALALAKKGLIIIPEETALEAGGEKIQTFIGTGPYKFEEWVPNQYIRLLKFDEYQSPEGEANGYGGSRIAYVDELKFVSVPDPTVRAGGVETGDFQYGHDIPSDDYERLRDVESVTTMISEPRAFLAFLLNNKEGPMADKLVRQAFLAALDMEPILELSRGNKNVWRANPSLMQKETGFYSEVGSEVYNVNNIEKAKELLAQSNYAGEPIRIQSGYLGYYNAGLAAKSMLEEAGFVIENNQYESSTESKMRKDSAAWDVSVTGITKVFDPLLYSFLSPTTPGWFENDEVAALVDEMTYTTDNKLRQVNWEKIQAIIWDEVPFVKLGDYSSFRLVESNVKNLQVYDYVFFWNVWLDKK